VRIMITPAMQGGNSASSTRPAYTLDMPVPIQPIVVAYDDQCAFCRARMRAIRTWDRDGRCRFIAIRDPDLLVRFPQLRGTELTDGLRVILPDGQIRVGADAVHAIALRLPAIRWLAPIYRVPGVRALARRTYAWIAAHRHALGRSCRTGSCRR